MLHSLLDTSLIIKIAAAASLANGYTTKKTTHCPQGNVPFEMDYRMECSRRQEQIFCDKQEGIQRWRAGLRRSSATTRRVDSAKVGMRILLPVVDEGMIAVDHGGDENATGNQADFSGCDVGQDVAGEVAAAAFGRQVLAYSGAGGIEGVSVDQEGLSPFVVRDSRTCNDDETGDIEIGISGEDGREWVVRGNAHCVKF